MFSRPQVLLRLGCWPCRTVTGFLLLLHDTVLDPELETESPGCLKDKAPPLNFKHFIIMLNITNSISFWQLFSFTPRFCTAVCSYNKTSGHLIFCIFTYLHVWNLASVSHILSYIFTQSGTPQKGRRQAAVRHIRCKQHQSFPMTVSCYHHTLCWI